MTFVSASLKYVNLLLQSNTRLSLFPTVTISSGKEIENFKLSAFFPWLKMCWNPINHPMLNMKNTSVLFTLGHLKKTSFFFYNSELLKWHLVLGNIFHLPLISTPKAMTICSVGPSFYWQTFCFGLKAFVSVSMSCTLYPVGKIHITYLGKSLQVLYEIIIR